MAHLQATSCESLICRFPKRLSLAEWATVPDSERFAHLLWAHWKHHLGDKVKVTPWLLRTWNRKASPKPPSWPVQKVVSVNKGRVWSWMEEHLHPAVTINQVTLEFTRAWQKWKKKQREGEAGRKTVLPWKDLTQNRNSQHFLEISFKGKILQVL